VPWWAYKSQKSRDHSVIVDICVVLTGRTSALCLEHSVVETVSSAEWKLLLDWHCHAAFACGAGTLYIDDGSSFLGNQFERISFASQFL
jgi:hypothetical protein